MTEGFFVVARIPSRLKSSEIVQAVAPEGSDDDSLTWYVSEALNAVGPGLPLELPDLQFESVSRLASSGVFAK